MLGGMRRFIELPGLEASEAILVDPRQVAAIRGFQHYMGFQACELSLIGNGLIGVKGHHEAVRQMIEEKLDELEGYELDRELEYEQKHQELEAKRAVAYRPVAYRPVAYRPTTSVMAGDADNPPF